MRVTVAGILALTSLLSATASGRAQMAPPSSPPPGLVSPYEIMYALRSAGFDPVAPPLREGTTYVARAADDRGILVRVVLDARSGAIRDVTPIMPGSGAYGGGPGIYGSRPGTYGGGAYGEADMQPPPDDMPPLYGEPPDSDSLDASLGGEGVAPPSALPSPHPVTRPTVTILPPLPRPRPAVLASQPAAAANSELTASETAAGKPDAKPAAVAQKPDAKTDVTSTVAPAAPVPAKPGKAPAGPPIND
jgi:hypothetical protein